MTENPYPLNMREYLAPPEVEANWVSPFLKWYVKILKSCNEEEFEEVIRCIRFDYNYFNGGDVE